MQLSTVSKSATMLKFKLQQTKHSLYIRRAIFARFSLALFRFISIESIHILAPNASPNVLITVNTITKAEMCSMCDESNTKRGFAMGFPHFPLKLIQPLRHILT